MSLGGIAIAIGAMVDAAVVMIENTHKHLEAWREAHPNLREPDARERWKLVGDAVAEVGPALFFSLLVITLSFVPVFALQAQEGRLFKPLAFTKTYSMAAAAGLSITLIPVLMGYLVRGRIRPEHANPINHWVRAMYQPLLGWALHTPRTVLVVAAIVLASALLPLSRLGSEFMPPLDEGTLLYMPTALPGLSAGKAAQLLQQTDRMLKTVPEVARVFGVAGRADTATDNAPLEMFDTTITFKPKREWRPGMTMDKLKAELDRAVQVPGLTNLFVFPIRSRTEMLLTGVKTPIGIKVMGPDLGELQRIAQQIENVARSVPGVGSAIAERSAGGRYVQVRIRRDAAARYGLSQQAVQSLIGTVVGGEPIGQTVQGLERFPIVLRYPRSERDSLAALRALPIVAPDGAQVTLGQVADLVVTNGPPMILSEDGVPATYVYVDTSTSDLGDVVAALQHAVAQRVRLPSGYTLAWAGQFQHLQHAKARLELVVPATLAIVFLLIYLVFRDAAQAGIILLTVPLGFVGGLWLTWLLGYAVSVAVVIGFIALAGLTAEFGVVMVLYLRHAWQRRIDAGELTRAALDAAIREGALLRVRPIAMTVAVVVAGLLPIMLGGGAGSELVRRIAAPMVGGMITAPLLSMLVIPAAFRLLERRRLRARSAQLSL
jgi:Cu(I)/Ag(I) efflux system membrane protein CusA/SilA